jgi:hypothetical protein
MSHDLFSLIRKHFTSEKQRLPIPFGEAGADFEAFQICKREMRRTDFGLSIGIAGYLLTHILHRTFLSVVAR